MRLVAIPPGTFLMGSPGSEEGRELDEALHSVMITRGYYLGLTEVTQAQYADVMGPAALDALPPAWRADDRPMAGVTWCDAASFCERLTAREGRTYRLPTEAEWERACRAGTTTSFPFGEPSACLRSSGVCVECAAADDELWWCANAERNPEAGLPPPRVGLKRANPWGLLDMNGGVAEWCQDWYALYEAASVDPRGPPDPPPGDGCTGDGGKVTRGGSYQQFLAGCRSAARRRVPIGATPPIGFRVVLESE
jgi:formylglycine-generating enzyme required for sulfatase activity